MGVRSHTHFDSDLVISSWIPLPSLCISTIFSVRGEDHSLSLTAFNITTTQFAALTKNISVSKHRQLTPLIDDDLTP